MPVSPDPSTLAPGRGIESADPAVRRFAADQAGANGEPRDKAVRLYYAVRDSIRYDPYVRYDRPETYSAAAALARGRGFCVPKAALLAACCRCIGIPARVGFADVRNHLATERLLAANGSDVFHWHAYTDVFLDGGWVKATPAFNVALCQRFGVTPLEFDGRADSLFHPFDDDGRRHMEYVRERGAYAEVPIDEIIATLRRVSPRLLDPATFALGGDFAGEAVV